MNTLTIPQTRARLERTLNAIWRVGDRDECSIKHIGYGLIALAFNRPWTEAVDYATPGGPGQDAGWYVPRLEKSWAKVAALREQVGHEMWVEAVLASEFAWYFAVRMPDAIEHYGIPADDPTLARAADYVSVMMGANR